MAETFQDIDASERLDHVRIQTEPAVRRLHDLMGIVSTGGHLEHHHPGNFEGISASDVGRFSGLVQDQARFVIGSGSPWSIDAPDARPPFLSNKKPAANGELFAKKKTGRKRAQKVRRGKGGARRRFWKGKKGNGT